jgi:hypothetical protein
LATLTERGGEAHRRRLCLVRRIGRSARVAAGGRSTPTPRSVRDRGHMDIVVVSR